MVEKICIILLINFVLYFRTLRYGPVSDDIPGYKHPRPFKNKAHKLYIQIFEAAKYHLKYDHLITLLVHALVGIFIYVVFGKTPASFLAGVLFSINPSNNQGAVWISGRSYAITTLLMLVAMSAPIVAPVALFISTYNPVGYFSPLAYIGTKVWYLSAAAPIFWFIHYRRFNKIVKERRDHEAVAADRKFSWRRVLVVIKTYGYYLTLCVVPFRLTFYHSLLESAAGNEVMQKRAAKVNVFTCVGVVAMAWLAISIFRPWTVITWGLYWYTICILPYLNIVRMQQEIAERYLYLANVGVTVVVASVIVNYPIAIAAFISAYVVRIWYYMPAYTDDYWVTEYGIIEDPRSWYCWHVRGHKLLDRKCWREALHMFVMAKLLSPKEFKVLFNIAVILKMMRKDGEADEFIKQAESNIVAGQEKEAAALVASFRKGELPFLL